MPAYMISYDLRRVRNYDHLIKQLKDWGCVRPLQSLWLGNLKGNAVTVRDILKQLMDADDGLIVCEIKPTGDWATFQLIDNTESVAWIRANIGA
ncbi:hypothetical protein ELI02_29995 (plasmid) [Rhizobium leguminosarum]|uniref:hypothetical protein n=1 Tax=Rhizobium leguminosarum TaxID=384 RepID=UPI001032263C|nr:hypothetical protein [Rhizobium leguminosarum]TAX45947.1 hypothetical protein ELI02_29995 [Rhizobium leguminosarum]